MPFITPPNYLVAPVDLPATTADPLTTEGGNTLDDGSGRIIVKGGTTGTLTLGLNSTGTHSGPSFISSGVEIDFVVNETWVDPAPGVAFAFKVGGSLACTSFRCENADFTGGTNTSASTQVTNPTITSGSAFTPNANLDSELCIQFDAASAGSWSLSMGPAGSGGTTYAIYSDVSMLAGSQAAISQHVPGGWEVVVTLATVTVASATVITK